MNPEPVNVYKLFLADVAQLVEQLIRNQQAGGSTPPVGSKHFKGITVTCAVIPFFILNHLSRQIKANSCLSAHDFVPFF